MRASERLRNQLQVPMSVMGGTHTILNLADVQAVLDENDRLRAALDGILQLGHNKDLPDAWHLAGEALTKGKGT